MDRAGGRKKQLKKKTLKFGINMMGDRNQQKQITHIHHNHVRVKSANVEK